jgi:uncharacterized protein YndB with AHSA1/START domain
MTYPTEITATAGLPFLDVVREFDAPVEAVFRAHTDANLYARWTGPRRMQLDNVEINPIPGGRWGFVFRPSADSPTPFSFSGVFHTVESNSRIVQTFEFNMAPGQVGISATTFTDLGGRTRLAIHEVYPSVEARDGALASGMEYGIKEGYERLDEVLAG